MKKLPFEIGFEIVTDGKTVTEYDVYGFAGITGDFSPNHVNEAYMSQTRYKHRIAHGLLGLSYSLVASTRAALMSEMVCVSYGYDRVRLLKPIYIGDTLTTYYTIVEKDLEKMTTTATVEIKNQNGELCTVARHILKYFPDDE